jgi:hypothetical protein
LYGEKRANWFVLVDMWGSGSDWTLQRGDSAMW